MQTRRIVRLETIRCITVQRTLWVSLSVKPRQIGNPGVPNLPFVTTLPGGTVDNCSNFIGSRSLKQLKTIVLALLPLVVAAQTQQTTDYSRMPVPGGREVIESVQSGEHWPAGIVNWYYNPANQPPNLGTNEVINAMQVAAGRWAQMCNLTFNYMGTTSANRNFVGDAVDRLNVIGWQPFPVSLQNSSAVTYWNFTPTTIVDADIFLNSLGPWSLADVDAVLTHEMGHMIGLQHSDVQASVMRANPYNSYAYQRTLRGDDAQGCATLYGAGPHALTNRTLNWAETYYASALQTGPVATQGSSDGYVYRYYAGSNSSAGAKNGSAFYTGPDGVLQNMGPVSGFTSQVTAAGF